MQYVHATQELIFALTHAQVCSANPLPSTSLASCFLNVMHSVSHCKPVYCYYPCSRPQLTAASEQGVALRCGLHGLAISLSCFSIGKSRLSRAPGQAGKPGCKLAPDTRAGGGAPALESRLSTLANSGFGDRTSQPAKLPSFGR